MDPSAVVSVAAARMSRSKLQLESLDTHAWGSARASCENTVERKEDTHTEEQVAVGMVDAVAKDFANAVEGLAIAASRSDYCAAARQWE